MVIAAGAAAAAFVFVVAVVATLVSPACSPSRPFALPLRLGVADGRSRGR